MAEDKIEFSQGHSSSLPSTGTNNNTIYFCNDTGELYKSTGNGLPLVKMSELWTGYEDVNDLINKNPAIEGKVYITNDLKLFLYDGDDYILLATDNELQRMENEDVRIFSEFNRQSNENNRVLAENQRNIEEDERKANELLRIQAYNDVIASIDILNRLEYFDYNSNDEYNFPNLVAYDGSTYIALKRVQGVTPIDDNVNYGLVARKGIDGTGAVNSINGQVGDVELDKSDIGLGNVDNTSDLNKPISISTQEALDELNNDKASQSDLDVTNNNLTTVSNALTSHLEQDNGKHIHSSGSNANGHWIKFDDGTMICWVYVAALALTNTIPANSDIENVVSFPATFASSEVASSFNGYVTDAAGANINTSMRKSHNGNGFWAFRIANPTTSTINRILDFMAIAIGRWK